MKLFVDRLTDEPVEERFEADASWWRTCGGGDEEAEAFAGPVRFVVAARKMGEDVFLEGTMSGAIEVSCSRCLKRYRHALEDRFRLVLEPARDREPPDPEGAEALARHGVCLGDELEVGWYRGKVLVLSAFFAEVIALALPVKPLCREDCPGLCAHCGADRSERACDCSDHEIESPFAALAALRERTGGGRES